MPKLTAIKLNKRYVLIGIIVFSIISLGIFSYGYKSTSNNKAVFDNEIKGVEVLDDEIDQIEESIEKEELAVEPQFIVAEEFVEEEDTQVSPSQITKLPDTKVTTDPTPAPKSDPPSNGSCPVSTQSCIPCDVTDGHWACRTEPGATSGYLGWSCQNNNPGNIRYSDARISYIQSHNGPAPCGERLDSRGGTYMIFSTYTDGRNALKAYFKAIDAATHTAYSECADGSCDLSYVFSKYAPYDPNYAKNIADKIGISVDTKFRWVVNNKLEELTNAVQTKEGFFVN